MNAMPSNSAANEITDAEFDALTAIAIREAGLSIPKSKKSLVQSRIARRFRSLNISSCKEYLNLLSRDASETTELVSVLTTNVSSFYREAHHFEFLRKDVFPRLEERLARGQPARIWSAGCSSGQEPYTIAMEVAKAFPNFASHDVLILATDIDPRILQRARQGSYSSQDLAGVAPEDRDRFFPTVDGASDTFQATDALKSLVRFRELNLHATWPMKATFDAIFCRNVVIYFDDEHQRKLWPRFRQRLASDGWLILGHSERIQNIETSGFTSAGVTIYRRTREN